MRYKLIAIDLDGTLTNDKKEVTPYTQQVLQKAAESGAIVALASGRPMLGILPVAKTLHLEELGGYILAYNGGQILDCREGRDLYRAVFPPECIQEAVEFAREHKVAIVTYDSEGIMTEGPVDEYVEHEAYNNHLPVKVVEDLPRYVTFPIVKLAICGEPDRLGAIEGLMAEQFAGRLDIYRAEPVFLEVMPLGIKKSAGLQRLMQVLHISPSELIAFGDANNDLPMLELAGFGVAMGNASNEVKKAADYVSKSNNEDGVAWAVQKFVLDDLTM